MHCPGQAGERAAGHPQPRDRSAEQPPTPTLRREQLLQDTSSSLPRVRTVCGWRRPREHPGASAVSAISELQHLVYSPLGMVDVC